MDDLKYYKLHKYCKNQFLAKGKNTVLLSNAWSIECDIESISFALDDFKEFLNISFEITLGEKCNKTVSLKLKEGFNNGFSIQCDENSINVYASTEAALVQGLYYMEDIMRQKGDGVWEIGEISIFPEIFPRLTFSALEYGKYNEEYLNILLHFGFNGVIFNEHSPKDLESARKMGMLVYIYDCEDKSVFSSYDGVILTKKPQSYDLSIFEGIKKVFCDLYWETDEKEYEAIIKALPSDSILLTSFDGGQAIEKNGVEIVTNNGALIMAQASDKFTSTKKINEDIEIWASTSAGGNTGEIGGVPYIPAMMQWFLRSEELKTHKINGSVDAWFGGFIPSIVGEFFKAQNLSVRDEGGICIQKLAGIHYGLKNTEKVMMAFKLISDGVNFFTFNNEDYEGPLAFGPAYPLIDGDVYKYDFSKDITLEIDNILNSANCFNRAAAILSYIEDAEAQSLKNILLFIVNTLVTCANTKRWYRRIYTIKETDLDFKKKFLYEQLIKIGEEEIKNALETSEILLNEPYLTGNNFESLCSVNALETKVDLTQKAVSEFKKKLSHF